MPTTSTLTLSLCERRHPLPDDVQGYVFSESFSKWHTANLTTMGAERLEQLAFYRLWGNGYAMYTMGKISPVFSDEKGNAYHIPFKSLRLYVNVMEYTPALIALLNVCRNEGIAVTLLHYDRDTNNYWEQEVSI